MERMFEGPGQFLLLVGIDFREHHVRMDSEAFSNTGAKPRQGPHHGARNR